MDHKDLVQYARSLYDAHGDRAEAEAAQKAVSARDQDKPGEAAKWTSIREHIRELRGARQT